MDVVITNNSTSKISNNRKNNHHKKNKQVNRYVMCIYIYLFIHISEVENPEAKTRCPPGQDMPTGHGRTPLLSKATYLI